MDTKKKSSRCNTITRSDMRSRNWCFTLNNYTKDDIKLFQGLDCEYVFQEEVGEEKKTPHLQGVLMYKNPRTFNTMKNIHRGCHWEPCKNKIASIRYCSKDETRSGEIYTNFDVTPYIGTDTNTTQIEKFSLDEEIEKLKNQPIDEKIFENPAWKKIIPKTHFDLEISALMNDSERKLYY